MAINETPTGLENELIRAVDELESALRRAADASASIRALLPKVGEVGSLFDQLDAVMSNGRQQMGRDASTAPPAYARPTLVVPSAPAHPAAPPQPFVARAAPEPVKHAETGDLTCFRLEFESRPGPLDLRTVDDAVNEHPAVRDVALLDYDGRKATLKVWIDGAASPADVRGALVERSSRLFAAGNDVTIVAIEDAA